MPPAADSATMFLALLLKEVGGEFVIHKDTFMGMPDEFEIMVTKNEEKDIKVVLIEDEALVKEIRARAEAKAKIIVP